MSSCSTTRASLSRDGRYLSVIDDSEILTVFFVSQSSNSRKSTAGNTLWKISAVRWSAWHSEEQIILVLKKNGSIEWKSFCNEAHVNQNGVILVDHLLRLLVSEKLEFNCLNTINILSYQRNHITLQTSARQIVVLELLTESIAAVSWGYTLSEFEVCEVCDRCFLVFEPSSRQLSIYSLFSGKLRKRIETILPEYSSDHCVHKIATSPNQKHLAILGPQLYLGNEMKLELIDLSNQHLINISMGDENIALVQEHSPEYLLFNYSSKQILHTYSMRSGDILLLCHHFNRFDKILSSTVIHELRPQLDSVASIKNYAYDSMLSNALTSQHFESCANILKLAGDGSLNDLCKILEVLNGHILANATKDFSTVLQKVIGAGLRFACQAYQKHPSCPRIVEFIFSWQDILLSHRISSAKMTKDEILPGPWIDDKLARTHLQNAILNNCLPLGQQTLLSQGHSNYRHLDSIRKAILNEIVDSINIIQMDFFDNATNLIKNLGSVSDSWEHLLTKLDDTSTRRNLVDFLTQRDLCNPRLTDFLKFLVLIEKHDSSVPTSRALKPEAMRKWERDEHRSYLAEIYLQEKDSDFIMHLQPREVWLVMVKRQILSGLRKWIETQFGSGASAYSLPYCWPIDREMIDLVVESHNCETKEAILNLLALHGVFTSIERKTLEKFVARVLKISQWTALEDLIQNRNSSVSFEELVSLIISYCFQQRRTALFWDMLKHSQIFNQNSLPTWMRFVVELHHNRGSLSTSAIGEIIRLNCQFLQEEHINHRKKLPGLTSGEILCTCLQGSCDYSFYSLIIPEESRRTTENFEIRTIPVALKAIDKDQLSLRPSIEENEENVKFWFHLVTHLRPIEVYYRIVNSVATTYENTKFSLLAAYCYGIAKRETTLRGVIVLLLRMCRIEHLPLTAYLLKHQIVEDHPVQILQNVEWNSNSGLVLVSSDDDLTAAAYQLSAETLSDCVKSLLVVHEEQPQIFSLRSKSSEIPSQISETTSDLLLRFLTEPSYRSSTSSRPSTASTFPTWQLLRNIITNPLSELARPSISLANKQKLELMCIRIMTEHAQSLTCLYIYIAARISRTPFEEEPSVDTVCNIILHAIESSKLSVVVEALNVIAPSQLLTHIINWLDSYSINAIPKSGEELLDELGRSSENQTEQLTFPVFCKLFHPSPILLSSFCRYAVRDVRKQLELLLELARATTAFPVLEEIFPNLTHLTFIAVACIEFKISIRTSALLFGDSNSEDFKHECEKVIKVLLRRKEFNRALEVAKSCGLPIDSILTTQLSSNLSRLLNSIEPDLRSRNAFWNRCTNFFVDHRVRPEVASTFFLSCSEQAVCHLEKHAIIDHSLNWAKKISQPTTQNEELTVKLEVLWWESKIECDIEENIHLTGDKLVGFSSREKFPLMGAKLEEISATFSQHSCTNYSARTIEEVVKLIDLKLDNEVLFEAYKLSVIFKTSTNDLLLILLLMRMVESPSEYDKYMEEARKIVSIDDTVANFKDHFAALEMIASQVNHGRPICDRLLVFYHVSIALDMGYVYVVEHKRPLCILKMLVDHSVSSNLKFIPGLGGLFNLASRWAVASYISSSEIVLFVRDELIETVRCAQSKICDTEASMVVSLLQGTFNRWVTLCKELTQLGTALLASSTDLQKSGEWVTAVEVLIFAHSSFNLACNVENIRQVLNQARSFIDELAIQKNWALITRLLTGLQRYAEMSYVFTLLKEADQFEYFLRKGMDRLPLLRQALLDFLRPSSSKNRELFRLVALHFHMHAEVATLWKEEANLLIEPVIRQAHGSAPIVRKASTTPLKPTTSLVRQSSVENSQRVSPVTVPKISINQETKNKLLAAMHDLAHAAEYFVQAGKLDHANECVLTAELYALQLSVLNSAKSEENDAVCVLGLNSSQVTYLIDHSLTYREAEILSRSYGMTVAWGRALLYHYVINGETDYLDQFKRRQDLSPVLVEELLSTLQTEVDFTTEDPELFERIAKILSGVPDVELSYRIGSRLSLVPLVTGILSSPSLSFLKDKVWGSA